MVEKLMPCPFCGEHAEIEDDCDGDVYVCCQGCQASGPPTRVGCRDDCDVSDEQLEQEAVDLWNKRQSLHVLAKALEDEAYLLQVTSSEPWDGGKASALRDVAKRLRGKS